MAPSSVKSPISKFTPRRLSDRGVRRQIRAFARAASLARMKERMEKAGGMENFERVINLFTPGPLPK